MMKATSPTRSPPPPLTPTRRPFGTVLSANSPPRPKSSTKKVKIRRSATKKSSSAADAHQEPSSSSLLEEYTVTFEPGPIGLELEPAQGGLLCRVQRFVDGGPKDPGAARLTGKIRPGDFVVAVNSCPVTSYDEAVASLKQQNQREITFRSAWNQLHASSSSSSERKEQQAVARSDNKGTTSTSSSIYLFGKKTNNSVPGSLRKTPREPSSPEDAFSSLKQTTSDPVKGPPTIERSTAKAPEMEESSKTAHTTTQEDMIDITLIQTPEDTALLSHALVHDSRKSSLKATSRKDGGDDDDVCSLHSNRSELVPTNLTLAMSPSRVKLLSAQKNESSSNDDDATTLSAKSSSNNTSVLRTVVKSVVPTAGVVASGSYAIGSILSKKLGETLVGHSSKEFDSTVQLKMKLLNELSQAKVALDAQQATIQSLMRDGQSERVRLQQDLETARREKEQTERSLATLKSKFAQGITSSPTLAENKLEGLEIQKQLRSVQQENDKLQDQVLLLEERLRLSEQKSQAEDATSMQKKLEDALTSLEEKTNTLEKSQRDLESLRSDSSSQQDMLREENKMLWDRLDQAKSELANTLSSSRQSNLRVLELEDANRRLEQQLAREKEQKRDKSSLSSADDIDKLREKDATIAHLQNEMKAAQSKVTNLTQELTLKDSSLASTSATLDEVNAEKGSFANDICKLTSIINEATDEKLRLQEKLHHAQDRIAELSSSGNADMKRTSAEVQKLIAEVELKDQSLATASTTVKKLRQERDELTTQVQELRSDLENANVEASRLQTLLDKSKSELIESRGDARSTTDELMERVELLESRAMTAERLLEEKERYLAEAHSKLHSANCNVEKLSADFARTELNLEAATNMIGKLEREQAETVRRERRLRAEIEDQSNAKIHDKAKLVEARREIRISELQRQVRSLEASKTTSDRKIESLTKSNEELSSQIDKLLKAVDDKDNELSSKRMECSAYMNSIEDVRGELSEKDEELKTCQRSLDKAHAQYAQLSDRLSHVLEESSKEKDSMTAELLALHVELADTKDRSETRIMELQRQIRSLEASKTTSDYEIDSLTKSNEELSSQIDKLLKAVDDKDNELSSKRMECSDYTNSIEDVRSELSEKTEEVKAYERALDKVQSQYTRLSERLSHVVEESSKEKDSMTAELLALQQELADTKVRLNESERLLRSIRRSAADSEARLAKAREQLERERTAAKDGQQSSEASLKKLKERIELLSLEAEQYKETSEKVEEERDHLKADVEALQRETSILKEELSASNILLETANTKSLKDRESLELQLSSERDKVSELSEKLRSVKMEFDESKRATEAISRGYDEQLRQARVEADSKARKQAEILESKESELRALNQYREEVRNANAEISRLEQSLVRSREEAEHLSAVIDEVRAECTTKIDKITESHGLEAQRFSEEKDELESALRKADERREAAESRIFSLEEGLVAARSERERLITEKHDLLSALHRTEDALSELRSELKAIEDEQSYLSDDSFSGEFSGLSKSDLKSKCVSLQEELHVAKARVNDASDTKRDLHLTRLQEDLELMSKEIENLVEANGSLKERATAAISAKEEAEMAAASLKTMVSVEEGKVQGLQLQLAQQQERNATLADDLVAMEERLAQLRRSHATREGSSKEEATTLKQLVSHLETEKEKITEELHLREEDVTVARRELNKAENRVSVLETELLETKEKLIEASQQSESFRLESEGEMGRYASQLSSLESECSTLRIKVAELEVEVETKRVELQSKEEIERKMSERLDKQRQDALASEAKHEGIVSKLAEASRVVASQKETISLLELRATEADRNSSSMASQVAKLQETIKKMESSAETAGDVRLQQLQDMDKKCAELDKERHAVHNEANKLRDDLRQARRLASDHEKMNGALKSRIDTMKGAFENTKSQLREARSALEESTASSKGLEAELEGKRMEADHLKNRIQVLNATISRLKSDHLLLKEAALQAEFQVAASEAKNEEVSNLKSQLKKMTNKLESLSEVYNSQQQVLGLSQTLEEKLLRFVEDVIHQVDSAFNKLSSRVTRLEHVGCRLNLQEHLDALDLAGLDQPKKTLCLLSSSLENLSSKIIPGALAKLEDKRTQLSVWKKQRSARVLSNIASTPDPKTKKTAPDTPNIMDALQKFKNLLDEEVLSPVKQQKSPANRLDVQYFHKVIHSLESQIDGLLNDLKSANDALQAKDKLFADLEQLVSHHESERDLLEEKLEKRNALLKDMDERLKREIAWKRNSDKELAKAREQLKERERARSSSEPSKISNTAAAKVAAGRLIVKFIENRSTASQSAAFHHWACQVKAERAVEQHGYMASELAQQLETTREKLCILKRHLKKSRRGREPGLDRILEGYETT